VLIYNIFTIARPNHVPLFLVVNIGSKISEIFSSGIPGPESSKVKRILFETFSTFTIILPSPLIA